MNWTTEQQQVIDLRHQNLLVSAAAGSGKTAVLVERILSLVTDEEHPVDIDRLLVVTFTRAAAGEMKDRIGKALEERLEKDPGSTHLQKQGVLLHHAQINTIDGFCTFVLQNYFHRIDLDPGYRIAEEDDLKLLRGRVLEDLMEEEYAEGGEAFLHFMEAYGTGKNDRKVTDLISRLYDFAVSNPDPDLWLAGCAEAYAPQTEEELEESTWIRELVREGGYRIEGLLQSAVQLRDFVMAHPEAPQAYLPALQSDVAMLSDLRGKMTYAGLYEAMAELTFEKLGSKKQPDMDPDLKDWVQKQRNSLKKQTESLKKSFFGMAPEQILEDLAVTRPQAAELIRLVNRFDEAYTAAKRKKNMIDFSDLEHLVLEILTERDEEGKRHPTAAAKELADRFEEVMIDEYQDSNFLQEAILSAVSRSGPGTGDRFMVGDMKQSIYGFRQARPELFLEKMNAYRQAGDVPVSEEAGSPAADSGGGGELSESAGVRIDLHHNFRSRRQVLETANALFSVLMVPELGGIAYDDRAALHFAGEYPDPPDPSFPETELLLIDKNSPEFDDDRSKAAMVEAEAHAAAAKIKECQRSGRLWDAKEQAFRPVQYRDCVILLRAAGTWGDTFVRVLQSEGIPAYTASGKGYFTTTEIETVLNYLRICDNPLQDIPLAAALRSPIGGMRDEDLAHIRIGTPEGTLYEALQKAAEGQEPVSEKAAHFLAQLESFRERVPRTPVHVLIRQILKETGYGDYAAAMPAGAQRQANLEMLAERAAAYEKNDYHGLFQFVRYVEQLTQREVDFGEVSLYGEEENIVRVMTIHKSKGLEFPVVILAGLSSGFNTSDEKSPVLMHAKMGIGMTAVYTEQRRVRSSTLRSAVQNAVRHDMLAEELRVLYVAMTRAKEKLILIGTGDGKERSVLADEKPSYLQLVSAASYMDWILMAADSGVPLRRETLSGAQMIREETDERQRTGESLAGIRSLLREGRPGVYSPETRERLAKIGDFRYESGKSGLPAKLTVSELKRMQSRQTAEEEQGAELYPEETVVPYVPRFLSKTQENCEISSEEELTGAAEKTSSLPEEKLTGAARGTAYHQVLAVLDYGRIDEIPPEDDPEAQRKFSESLQEQIREMYENGLLSEAEYRSVRTEDIAAFVCSPIGKRMAAADRDGTLRREQPFVLDLPASQISQLKDRDTEDTGDIVPGDTVPEETILIQGTIDAYWEEDGAYILADYKTDRIRDGEESVLAERYRVQLEYYQKALEQITEIPVREKYIYALATGKSIAVRKKQ